MVVKYFLALVMMMLISLPIMLLCSIFTSYLLNTVIDAWSVEWGNLQIIGWLFQVFGVSREITVLVGQFFVAEIILAGAIFGLTFATHALCQKYLDEVKITKLNMFFATIIGILALFFDISIDGIFKIVAVINIYALFYFSAWATES